MSYTHDKGRDCERTDEVLANYKRRALIAEQALALIRQRVDGLPDHPWIPGAAFADGAILTLLGLPVPEGDTHE